MTEDHTNNFNKEGSSFTGNTNVSGEANAHIGDVSFNSGRDTSVNIGYQPSTSLEALLGNAKEAHFDFYHRGEFRGEYHEGTRLPVLNDIYRWIEADEGCVFWLNGMAGTGKSIIAREVASRCHKRNQDHGGPIVTSFFFSDKRDDVRDARLFVTSLAVQLSGTHDPFSKLLQKKSQKYQGIGDRRLQSQWDELIMKNISELNNETTVQVIIVIDALDQCQDEEDIQQVLKIIKCHAGYEQRYFKFLVTSRRREFIRFDGDIQQCDLDTKTADEDIRKYLGDLTGIQINALEIDALVEKCEGLFICAATAKKYIQGRLPIDREHALREILDNIGTSDTGRALDRIYSTVLGPLSTAGEPEARVHSVLCDMGILFSPLRISSLSKLLARNENEIRGVIESYSAIFNHPMGNGSPVLIHHSYLSDFLFDNPLFGFQIVRRDKHREMANHCLNLMKDHLKQNICDSLNFCVTIADMAVHHLDPEMEYACRHWIQHLLQVQFNKLGNDLVGLVEKFLGRYFIEWMEAMSVLKLTSDAVRRIKELGGYIRQAGMNRSLISFLEDAERFILTNRQMAEKAPLQLYSSGLMFCPESSVIRKRFKDSLSEKYNLRKRNATWNKVLQSLEGHKHWINSIAFSSSVDTMLVASGSADYTVSLWDPNTGELRMTDEHHSHQVNCVAFSTDSSLLASGSDDKTIKIWDHTKNEITYELQGHEGHVTSIAFSPGANSELLASGSNDGRVRVWNYRASKVETTRLDDQGPINSVAFLSDHQSTQLIAVTCGRVVKLWNYERGQPIATLYVSPRKASLATFSPDGRLLAFASRDSIQIWSCTTRNIVHDHLSHSSRVTSIAFSPDLGTLVAAGSQKGSIRIWDQRTGQVIRTLNSHSEQVRAVAFSFHHGARLLVSGSDDRLIKMWDVNEGDDSYQEIHPAKPSALAFSHNGGRLASSSSDEHVKMWDPNTGDLLPFDMKHDAPVKSISFSPDGRFLGSAAGDRKVKLWKPDMGCHIRTLHDYNKTSTVTFSPNRQMIAYGSVSNRAHVVKIVRLDLDWTEINSGDNCGEVYIVAFSPDSKQVASTTSGSSGKTIRVWDSSTGQSIFEVGAHTKKILCLSFSPSGRLLASGSEDWTAKIWDSSTGELWKPPKRHDSRVESVQFSPDGKLFAATSHVGTTKLWKVASPDDEHCLILEDHSGLLWSEKGFFVTIEASQWLCFNGERRLSLPVEYRKACMALQGNVLALGSSNGQVSFITIPEGAQEENYGNSSASRS